jgi:3-methyladenine DNA glycosylase Tag
MFGGSGQGSSVTKGKRLVHSVNTRHVYYRYHEEKLSKERLPLQNARAFLQVQEQFGSFDAFLWQFVGGVPRQNAWQTYEQIPASTPESDAMSKALKRRGFRFVGSTICYALMQAVGMVNDHVVDCFRWAEIRALAAQDADWEGFSTGTACS